MSLIDLRKQELNRVRMRNLFALGLVVTFFGGGVVLYSALAPGNRCSDQGTSQDQSAEVAGKKCR